MPDARRVTGTDILVELSAKCVEAVRESRFEDAQELSRAYAIVEKIVADILDALNEDPSSLGGKL